jgi:hypothetical protein
MKRDPITNPHTLSHVCVCMCVCVCVCVTYKYIHTGALRHWRRPGGVRVHGPVRGQEHAYLHARPHLGQPPPHGNLIFFNLAIYFLFFTLSTFPHFFFEPTWSQPPGLGTHTHTHTHTHTYTHTHNTYVTFMMPCIMACH